MADIVKINKRKMETIVECGHLVRGACAKCVVRHFDANQKAHNAVIAEIKEGLEKIGMDDWSAIHLTSKEWQEFWPKYLEGK